MSDIILATLNARYAHSSFALRYLLANMAELQGRAAILEFDISQRVIDVAESILAAKPRIVGIGVYVWNADPSAQLVALLKKIQPDLTVIIGGPEVSHETDQQDICATADYVITGEADLAFVGLCRQLLDGTPPTQKIIPAEPPVFEESKKLLPLAADRVKPAKPAPPIVLPYDLYTDEDIAHRVIYVEASRGCPFKCEFCLSSLDVPVRNVPLEHFLAAMQPLLDRGARHLKFVDRTFNLNLNVGRSILRFFLDRYRPGLFLHFEMIPDRLPDGLRELISQFPPASLQFEVGIQTFNEEVADRINRRQDNSKVEENFRFLRQSTGVHIHADLIAGLPGETMESFATGFDRLIDLSPQEIQVGILKRLRGAPISRHDQPWAMAYTPYAPYEILRTSTMDFMELQRMRRFSRYWDLVGNSGNFVESVKLLWQRPHASCNESPFVSFMAFTDWLFDRLGQRTHGIALHKLAEHLFEYLTQRCGHRAPSAGRAIAEDFRRVGREIPDALRLYAPALVRSAENSSSPSLPARQAKHLGITTDQAAKPQ